MRDLAHNPVQLARARNNVVKLRAFEPKDDADKYPQPLRGIILVLLTIFSWTVVGVIAWGVWDLLQWL